MISEHRQTLGGGNQKTHPERGREGGRGPIGVEVQVQVVASVEGATFECTNHGSANRGRPMVNPREGRGHEESNTADRAGPVPRRAYPLYSREHVSRHV